MSIAIVTDSTSDLPKDVIEKHGITVVPLNVRFGMEEFKDGIDIDNDEFYRRLQIESELPTTSQPSLGDFSEAYRSLIAEHDGIVSIHISGKLSQTINSATQGGTVYVKRRLCFISTICVGTCFVLIPQCMTPCMMSPLAPIGFPKLWCRMR